MYTFPFYFTHSLGRFLTTLNLHVQILNVLFYWTDDELVRFAWSLELPSARLSVFPVFFCSVVFFSLCISLSYHPMSFICSLLSCVDIYMCITVIMIYYNFFIACSCYFILSMYTWGILLAYLRRQLSSRLRFHVLWQAGRDKISVMNNPKIFGGTKDKSFWKYSNEHGIWFCKIEGIRIIRYHDIGTESLKILRKFPMNKQCASNFKQMMVFTFSNTILLRIICTWELMNNTIFSHKTCVRMN